MDQHGARGIILSLFNESTYYKYTSRGKGVQDLLAANHLFKPQQKQRAMRPDQAKGVKDKQGPRHPSKEHKSWKIFCYMFNYVNQQ